MQKEPYEIIVWANGRIRDWLLNGIKNVESLGFVAREIDSLLSLQTSFFNKKPELIFISPTAGYELYSLLQSLHPHFSPTFWSVVCCFEKIDIRELLRLRRLGVEDFLFWGENHKLTSLLRYYAICFQMGASHYVRQDYNYFKSIPAKKEYSFPEMLPIKRLNLSAIPKIEQETPNEANSPEESDFSYKPLLAALLPSENDEQPSASEADYPNSEKTLIWEAEELWLENGRTQTYLYGSLLFSEANEPILLGKCDFDSPFTPSPSQATLLPIGLGVFDIKTGACRAANTAFQFYLSWFTRDTENARPIFDFSESYTAHLTLLSFWGEENCNFITDAVSALSPENPSCSFYFYRVSHFQTYRFHFEYTQDTDTLPGIFWVIQPLNSDVPSWQPLRKILKTENPLYTQLYESAPEAIFLVDGISLLILDCNPKAVALFEAESKERLTGIWGSILHKFPENFPKITDIAFTLKSKHSQIAEVEYQTFRGNFFWGNLVSQFFFYQEKFPYIIVRVIDITRSYLMESAQFQLMTRLNLVLEASDSAFWEWNVAQNIIYYSPKWRALYEIELESVKTDFNYWQARLHPEDRIGVLENVRRLLSGEIKNLTWEYRIITEKGNCKWVADTVKAVDSDSSGKPILVCGIVQNITDRKRKENEIAEHQVALLKAILQGEEQERMRFSQELHDGLGQQLQTILFRYALIAKKLKKEIFPSEETIDYLTHLLNEAAEETRAISHNLSPLILEKHSLPEALTLFCERLKNEKTPSIELSLHSLPHNIPALIKANLYRIAQELVQNAIKHAKAQKIHVYLDFHQNKILLLVKDDGVGLPENWDSKKESGIGLKNIRTRAELLGGNISIYSTFRAGCAILIEIPVPTP